MDASVQSSMLLLQPDLESEPQPGPSNIHSDICKSVKEQMENCGYSVIRVILGYTENVQVCKIEENGRNIQKMEQNRTSQIVNN
ncbi:hypothetical protein DPMN_165156 [Dreissena polymorpha]|uniref:Uncharacterized protein n=1 Tax=Dreissena polymorpha TaxID=45954 RepID=A0A9D4F028_DREPO|nr:hypothetical protein DPMN_165156 [Dreissena polymorpha]